MNFLIYGGSGWIGSKVVDHLKSKNYKFILGQCRVEDKEGVEQEIKNVNPTHVMCFTGRTHGKIGDKVYNTIDYLEQYGKTYDNVRDNLFGPMVLALLCVKYNVHLTYLGTGCIFTFDNEHPFGEEINGFKECDKPNFTGSSYSAVKGFTDELMHFFDDSVLSVRIRMPISADVSPRNFITKITTYEKICSIPNSMTVLPELIPIMVDMAVNKQTGTINLVNPGLISHNEILQMYKEIVDPSFSWKNFTLEEQSKILAAPRSNNFLDTTKLKLLYPTVKNIKESVKDILLKIKENKN